MSKGTEDLSFRTRRAVPAAKTTHPEVVVLVQLIQVTGSLLILTAFVASQRGRLSTSSMPYLVLNLVGSAVLAVLAALHHEYGFLLLEGVWAVVSAAGVAAALRARLRG